MKSKALILLALFSFVGECAPQASENEGLLWLANELSLLRAASHEMQLRQEQSSPNVFDFDALQMDLSRMITEIEAKVHDKGNPAYQYEPLQVEAKGY
jgi:hypothetical protein